MVHQKLLCAALFHRLFIYAALLSAPNGQGGFVFYCDANTPSKKRRQKGKSNRWRNTRNQISTKRPPIAQLSFLSVLCPPRNTSAFFISLPRSTIGGWNKSKANPQTEATAAAKPYCPTSSKEMQANSRQILKISTIIPSFIPFYWGVFGCLKSGFELILSLPHGHTQIVGGLDMLDNLLKVFDFLRQR